MYCTKCGKQLDDETRHCMYCGAKVRNSIEQMDIPSNTGMGRNRILISCMIASAVFLIAVLAVALHGKLATDAITDTEFQTNDMFTENDEFVYGKVPKTEGTEVEQNLEMAEVSTENLMAFQEYYKVLFCGAPAKYAQSNGEWVMANDYPYGIGYYCLIDFDKDGIIEFIALGEIPDIPERGCDGSFVLDYVNNKVIITWGDVAAGYGRVPLNNGYICEFFDNSSDTPEIYYEIDEYDNGILADGITLREENDGTSMKYYVNDIEVSASEYSTFINENVLSQQISDDQWVIFDEEKIKSDLIYDEITSRQLDLEVCAKQYINIVKQYEEEYPDMRCTYDLIYNDEDDMPELVVGINGYWTSLYTYDFGQIYTLMDRWAYGTGSGYYYYLPRKNVIYRSGTGEAGLINYDEYWSVDSNFEVNPYYENTLSIWMFKDKNNDGELDYEKEVVGIEGCYYYYGTNEITKEQYDAYKIEGDFQKLLGTKSATDIMRDLEIFCLNEDTLYLEYVFPNSNSEFLTKEDLMGLTAEECRIARNELYARYGRIFTDEALRAHFEACTWYQGTIMPEDFDENVLNEYEMANRDLIIEYWNRDIDEK